MSLERTPVLTALTSTIPATLCTYPLFMWLFARALSVSPFAYFHLRAYTIGYSSVDYVILIIFSCALCVYYGWIPVLFLVRRAKGETFYDVASFYGPSIVIYWVPLSAMMIKTLFDFYWPKWKKRKAERIKPQLARGTG